MCGEREAEMKQAKQKTEKITGDWRSLILEGVQIKAVEYA